MNTSPTNNQWNQWLSQFGGVGNRSVLHLGFNQAYSESDLKQGEEHLQSEQEGNQNHPTPTEDHTAHDQGFRR